MIEIILGELEKEGTMPVEASREVAHEGVEEVLETFSCTSPLSAKLCQLFIFRGSSSIVNDLKPFYSNVLSS